MTFSDKILSIQNLTLSDDGLCTAIDFSWAINEIKFEKKERTKESKRKSSLFALKTMHLHSENLAAYVLDMFLECIS